MSQDFSETEDFIVREELSEVDPDSELIIDFEEERQARRLILIPSESLAPLAVRQALGSVFNNVYAEGYPPLQMTREEVSQNRGQSTPYSLAQLVQIGLRTYSGNTAALLGARYEVKWIGGGIAEAHGPLEQAG